MISVLFNEPIHVVQRLGAGLRADWGSRMGNRINGKNKYPTLQAIARHSQMKCHAECWPVLRAFTPGGNAGLIKIQCVHYLSLHTVDVCEWTVSMVYCSLFVCGVILRFNQVWFVKQKALFSNCGAHCSIALDFCTHLIVISSHSPQ